MQGDKLVIQPWHEKAAIQVAELLVPVIRSHSGRYTISVAGESGAGKSEVAFVLADRLNVNNLKCAILQQDDYFVYPPMTNAEMRKKDIGHVGLSEVRLDLIDQHLGDFLAGKSEIEKPLMIFEEDRCTSEDVNFDQIQVVIAEGTYTTTLENISHHVFIDRTYHDTKISRKLRDREKQDDFLEKILLIEHEIISSHKKLANIIVTREYKVEKINGNE